VTAVERKPIDAEWFAVIRDGKDIGDVFRAKGKVTAEPAHDRQSVRAFKTVDEAEAWLLEVAPPPALAGMEAPPKRRKKAATSV
jgi:hypothetical protein